MGSSDKKLIAPLLRSHRVTGNWKIDDLVRVLAALENFDMAVEKKIKVTRIIAIVCFVAAILPAFFGFFYALPGIVPGIIFIVLFFRYRKFDVDNEVRLFVKPIVEMLRHDVKPESDVVIDLPLLPLDNESFLKSKSAPYAAGNYPKCVDFNYERDLLKMKLSLVDGNKLMFTAGQTLKKTSKTKRNPRGKTKTKFKFAKRSDISVVLKVNPEKFKSKKPDPGKGATPEAPRISVEGSNGAWVLSLEYTNKPKGADLNAMMLDPVVPLEGLTRMYAALRAAEATK